MKTMKILKLTLLALTVSAVSAQADLVDFWIKKITPTTYDFWTTRALTGTDTSHFYEWSATLGKWINKATIDGGAHRGVPWGPYNLGHTIDQGGGGGSGGGGNGKLHGPSEDPAQGFKIHFVNTTGMVTRTYWVDGQFVSNKTGNLAGNVYMKGNDTTGYSYAADDSDIGKGSVITPGTGILSPFHWSLSSKLP
jgi:hypothetical protein